MFPRALRAPTAVLCLGAALSLNAHAGRRCEPPQLPKSKSIEYGLQLAQRTQDALNRSGADVVLLARAGQNLSEYGLRYSHLGFAYRGRDTSGAPVWRVVHKLNDCGTLHADLYRQGLGEFFLDDPWRYEALAIVPRAEVQARLLPVLEDEASVKRLHQPQYSLVSYAWGQKYQQSNQWALETLAMAQDSSPGSLYTRTQAQAWLTRMDYRPTVLKLGPLTRLGARMGQTNVAFDDHPNDKRYSDRIETVTVDSAIDWMRRSGLADKLITLPEDLQGRGLAESVAVVTPRPQPASAPAPMAASSASDANAGYEAFRNKDYARAYQLLLPRAAAGEREAQFTVGLMLQNGYGRAANAAEAARWFRQAAEQNYSPAEYKLGAAYTSGDGVARDLDAAIQWLSRALGHGNQGAKVLLDQTFAQKRAEDLAASRTARAAAAEGPPLAVNDSQRIVVRPDPLDDVPACVRQSRTQCTSAETEGWTQDFLRSLRQSVRYPASAVQNRRAGEVELSVSVCAEDSRARATVRTSSGFEDLDNAALQAAQRLAVQAPLCSGVRAPISLSAPISFTLDAATR